MTQCVRRRTPLSLFGGILLMSGLSASAAETEIDRVAVERQPLAANIERTLQALRLLGRELPGETGEQVRAALADGSARDLQAALDQAVLLVVEINPESRVRVVRGPAEARIVQHGYTPVLVKILNAAALTDRLRITSPQAGPVYAGASLQTLERQQQTELLENANVSGDAGRVFDVEMFLSSPMTARLSGLEAEYALALIYCAQSGRREATIGFHVGQGTQDLGFRGEAPVLFDVLPAVPVRLSIRDDDGSPTTARLTFRDARGNVHPPQAKRLAPDLFFQPQIYRRDGETVLLAPGTYQLTTCRGPEYHETQQTLVVSDKIDGGEVRVNIALRRWIAPMQHGYFSGDHHIHGAGCSHYESPTEGVGPSDMFPQVQGEGLNVGCVLTWGPCFEFQRNYFSPGADALSEPLTLLKYEIEISGFGSAALGHVCLLNLRDQTYPGSEGTKSRGWPTWTVPALRWAREQGAVTGYPHSDMRVDPPGAAAWLLSKFDRDDDGQLDADEARAALLPEPFADIDRDGNGRLSRAELESATDRSGRELPHLALPSMGGAGAMEIFVAVNEGVCDFISAMDTGRIGEWNTWYHILNCGYPLKLSGETDFPCMSSRRVGQGRVYVKLGDGPRERIEFPDWVRGLAAGRSYVSDGFAHALTFEVNGTAPGAADVRLDAPGTAHVRARVAFAPRIPRAVAYGTEETAHRRNVGDTVLLHAPRNEEWVEPGTQTVEFVRNGVVIASREVPADGGIHELELAVPVERSSWLAVRQFPQLHSNPVNVIVADRPIRASSESARWCAASVELLWENRNWWISEEERPAARAAYDRTIAEYLRRADEAAGKAAAGSPGDPR